jgi:hypothetical protein
MYLRDHHGGNQPATWRETGRSAIAHLSAQIALLS